MGSGRQESGGWASGLTQTFQSRLNNDNPFQKLQIQKATEKRKIKPKTTISKSTVARTLGSASGGNVNL